jgi:hypothetical protein
VGEGALDLARLVRDELSRPAPPHAKRLAEAIRAQVGPATAAVVFYGSCLRKETAEGVLDFYVLVDDYRSALGSGLLAAASAALPPSVFYIECPGESETLRCKYALLSLDDFAQGAAPGGFRTGIFARFCQPALAVYVRDEAVREALVAACVDAVLTATRIFAPVVDSPASSEELWQTAFAETYAAEMRAEGPEAIRSLHDAAPERYSRVLRGALAELDAVGVFAVRWQGERFAVEASAGRLEQDRRAWRRRRTLAKLVYVAQLLKTAFTMGDWLPYALWKLERQSGVHIPYSERQRRHPFIFGWPLLVRALRTRALH